MQIGRCASKKILAVLSEAEQGGATISALLRKHNIDRVTFYRWRKAYGGPIRPRTPSRGNTAPTAPTARDPPNLERENAQLKRPLADCDLEVDLLKQALGKRW